MDPGPSGSASAGGRGSGGRTSFQWGCRLPNTVHSEYLPPMLPLERSFLDFGFGEFRYDEPLAAPDRSEPEMIMQAADIARILAGTDISHLGFTPEDNVDVDPSKCSSLWREVLRHNPDAFEVKAPGPSSQGKRSAN